MPVITPADDSCIKKRRERFHGVDVGLYGFHFIQRGHGRNRAAPAGGDAGCLVGEGDGFLQHIHGDVCNLGVPAQP